LAENILNRISNHSSIAPNDDKVSAKEFSVICQRLATFWKQSYSCEQRPKESADVERKVVENRSDKIAFKIAMKQRRNITL